MSVVIRLAEDGDFDDILKMHLATQHDALDVQARQKGYLSSKFPLEDIREVIQRQEAVICSVDHIFVGYYMVNNITMTETMKAALAYIKQKRHEGVLDKSIRYAYGPQTVVREDYRNKGLSRLLLEELCENIADKYDYICGRIAKGNPNALAVHAREGWEKVADIGDNILVMLDPKKHLKL